MKPIITIDGFSKGIIDDETLQLRDGFSYSECLDIHTNPGTIQVREKVSAMTETDAITSYVNWMNVYSSDVYALAYGGKIYKYSSGWALVHTDTNFGSSPGMGVYGSNLYWASNGKLGMFNGTTWTDTYQSLNGTETTWHPMKVFIGKLMIGDGRYIATWDGTTWNNQALTLPVGYRVKSLEVYGDRLVIGTWKGANIYDYNEAILFTWDGDENHTYEQAIDVKESGVNSMKVWNNVLWLSVGIKGNIYTYDGASLRKFLQIPGTYTGGAWGQVYPDGMDILHGNLIVGWSTGTTDNAGIYMIGRKDSSYPIVKTLDYIVNEKTTSNNRYYSVFANSTNSVYFSRLSGSTYGIDNIDISRRYSSAYFESQIYEVETNGQARLIKGISLQLEPLQTSNSVAISYDIDNSGSYTSLGTIDSTNQYDILPLMKRANTIQFKFTFSVNSLNYNSPKLSKIMIY